MNTRANRGFTLVELLVVIAIIGVLVAMAIPAVQSSRETGHRNLCRNNMAQLLLALESYENAFETYPAGVTNPEGPIRSEPVGLHQGWLIRLLPYLDERNAYRQVDVSASVYAPPNAAVREHWPRIFICPSEPNDTKGASNYAGCHHDVEAPIAADNQGVLFLNSRVRREDVSDGLAYTFFVGEKRMAPDDLGWMSGTRATLRNTGLGPNDPKSDPVLVVTPAPDEDGPGEGANGPLSVGGFASGHVGGLMMGCGDASVRFVTDQVDLQVWQKMGHRADGKLVELQPAD
jgi:prepilin-type N-terminal cleavage/methylation domain-containing protein